MNRSIKCKPVITTLIRFIRRAPTLKLQCKSKRSEGEDSDSTSFIFKAALTIYSLLLETVPGYSIFSTTFLPEGKAFQVRFL